MGYGEGPVTGYGEGPVTGYGLWGGAGNRLWVMGFISLSRRSGHGLPSVLSRKGTINFVFPSEGRSGLQVTGHIAVHAGIERGEAGRRVGGEGVEVVVREEVEEFGASHRFRVSADVAQDA